eukprot:5728711-Amphidinium_carterae.2
MNVAASNLRRATNHVSDTNANIEDYSWLAVELKGPSSTELHAAFHVATVQCLQARGSASCKLRHRVCRNFTSWNAAKMSPKEVHKTRSLPM